MTTHATVRPASAVPRRSPRRPLLIGGLALLALLLVPLLARAEVEGDLGRRLSSALTNQGGVWLAYLLAFVAGLATSLTPCVYPLIPITMGLFGARAEETTRKRALGLAACYVGGIAAMYTGLGVFFGLTGKAFGTFMASPLVIVPIALFFVAMAASMFGAFELALPNELQGRLAHVGGKGPGGAFVMGLVAGIIAAPCTGPPLAVLLAFVSTQRSVFLGGSLLFVYALGMGVLFFLIAGFALKLPRSGAWMEAVKSVFGVVMLVAALYFLRNVVPALRDLGRPTPLFLSGSVALCVAGAALGAIHLSVHDGLLVTLRKAAGVLLLCAGLFGGVAFMLAAPASALTWISDEATALQAAKAQRKPLLIDFAADWCLPCKELELKTFAEPRVSAELGRFVLLRIDATESTDAVDALKARYGAETLPTVLVKDSSGQTVLKITEFTTAERLLPILQKTR